MQVENRSVYERQVAVEVENNPLEVEKQVEKAEK